MLIGQNELQLINAHQARKRHEPSLIRASVALILRDTPKSKIDGDDSEQQHGTEVLMMQRAKHERDPWSGQMSFPGGKIEDTDASPLEAAIREAFEEVGAQLGTEECVGQLDDLYGLKVGDTFSAHVSCFVFKPKNDIQLKANHEVADMVWLPLEYLNDSRNAFAYKNPVDPSLSMPSVMINKAKEQVLWGMSLRMLMNLYDLLSWPLAVLNEQDMIDLGAMENRHLSKENADKLKQKFGHLSTKETK